MHIYIIMQSLYSISRIAFNWREPDAIKHQCMYIYVEIAAVAYVLLFQ